MNSALPKISILMSVYNEPNEWLDISISSILDQTFQDFEFIIILDNPLSIDNKNLVKNFQKKDKRIFLIENEVNIGLTKSLNKGLGIASGKYIVRMDGDDISNPDRLKKQFEYMESNLRCVASGTYFKLIDEKGFDFGNTIKLPLSNEKIKELLFIDNAIAHPTSIIRNDILKEKGIKYNEEYKYSQDYGLWCELSKIGELNNLPNVLVKYRISKNQISNSKRNEQQLIVKKIRDNYIKDYLLSNLIDIDFENKNYLKFIWRSNIPINFKIAIVKGIILNRKLNYSSFTFMVILNFRIIPKINKLFLEKYFKNKNI
ncbi:MAG: glycosyltransferase [Bacteroidetes bacterium]|nr:glycosyltransferase [Bacteroidota bacterium]